MLKIGKSASVFLHRSMVIAEVKKGPAFIWIGACIPHAVMILLLIALIFTNKRNFLVLLEQGIHSHGGLSEELGHFFLIAGLEDAIDET
jgi:hypothetical protein